MQADLFVSEGVNKIRVTGGEPTVRRDLAAISQQLTALLGLQTLAMTTNGIALSRQLPALRAAGMSALNISLDTLQEERFVELTRRQGCARVLRSIHEAVAQGFQVKVNVVLMRGVNDDELLDFVALAEQMPINVRFIEYMPFDDNAWSRAKMVRLPSLRVRLLRLLCVCKAFKRPCSTATGAIVHNCMFANARAEFKQLRDVIMAVWAALISRSLSKAP